MSSTLATAIVRLRHATRAIVGAGFLVGERRVITCAHVVADALELGFPERCQLMRPHAEVLLDFPLLRGTPEAVGSVEVWLPPGPGGGGDNGYGDIAVLQLLDEPPTDALPVDRVLAGNLWRRRFGTFGFPAGNDEGVYTSGRCLGPQASGWLQVESSSEYRIERGYSGAPAWDEERNLVVGMVVAAEGARTVRAGWIIPGISLADICQGLEVVELTEVESAAQAGAASPAIFRAPPRNPIFTGREQLLTDITAVLTSRTRTALVQAITGLGGAGKTQAAIEYVHRHRNDYRVIWWIRAETPETLLEDLVGLAFPLGLPVLPDSPPSDVASAVFRWLETNPGWLLVFDNAESLDLIRDRLPDHGHVLITSRNPAWRSRATVLDVDVWSPQEAVTFLVTRTGRTDLGDDASALAEALGHLPLALEQAGAYMEANATSFARYLQLFQGQSTVKLLAQHQPADYAGTVATTWRLAFNQVSDSSLAATELLELCAFVAPEAIPEDIFQPEDRSLLPSGLREANDEAFESAMGVLRRYSLLQRSDGTLALHRLVQEVLRHALSPEVFRQRAGASVLLISAAFPKSGGDILTWPRCGQLLPHALTAAGHAEGVAAELEITSGLLARMGTYLQRRAELIQARALFERALAIAEAAYGRDHPTVALRVNDLASVLQDLGDQAGARQAFERALTIAHATLGPDHPTVPASIGSLTGVRGDLGDPSDLAAADLGDLEEARQGFQRAISIGEAVYGPDHPTVALRVNNLALVLQALGDLDGARRGLERALAIVQAARGSEHPTVASCLNNLAGVLRDLGDLADARRGLERALAIDEAAYGADHPAVARDLSNLALVLRKLGDLAGARWAFQRALAVAEATYGPDHPTVIHITRLLRSLE